MPVYVDPAGWCDRCCLRPKETGEDVCTPCRRLLRSVGRDVETPAPLLESFEAGFARLEEWLSDE